MLLDVLDRADLVAVPLPLPPSGVRLQIENQAALPALVEATFYNGDQVVRRSMYLLDASGPASIRNVLSTRADRVTVKAIVAGLSPPEATARLVPGDVIVDREFLLGEHFNPGETLVVIIPGEPIADVIDCNENGILDALDIAQGASADCDGNGVPDVCGPDTDCNENGVQDFCDIATGTSDDCDANGVPDECVAQSDCNSNGITDLCDIARGTSEDCNNNGIPDECDTDDLGRFDDHLFVWDGNTLFVSETATLAPIADIVGDPGALGSSGGFDDGRHMVVDTPGRRIFVTDHGDPLDVYNFNLIEFFPNFGVFLCEPLGIAPLPNGQLLVTDENADDSGCFEPGMARLDSDLSSSGDAASGRCSIAGTACFADADCPGDDTCRATLFTPEGVVYDAIHDRVFVADEDEQRIVIFNGTTLAHIADVDFCTGSEAAYWLGVDGSSNHLFMLAETRACPDFKTGNYGIHVFDILSGGDHLAFNQTLLGSNGGPSECFGTLAVSESTDRLFAIDYCNDTVAIFDTASLAFLRTVPVGRSGTNPLMISVGHVRSGTSADCNFNGVPDECDIANGTSPDSDGNGIPDECEFEACCLPGASCSDMHPADCSNADGTPQGPGTSCAQEPCGQ